MKFENVGTNILNISISNKIWQKQFLIYDTQIYDNV